MDAFFVSCELLRRPTLVGKPVIVGGPLRRRGVVASASYEARRFGIKSGMAADFAHRLCPEAIFITPDFSFYEEYSKKVHQILTQFSPIVAMTSIDEAYLDITGTTRLFGEPLALGKRIKEEIRKLGLPSTIGIAKNPTLAKIATNLAKPDGLLYIPKGQEADYINHLDIEAVPGIGEKTAGILRSAGIKTIGDFLEIDLNILNSIIGRWAKNLREALTEERGLEISGEVKSISRNRTLPQDTRRIDFLESVLYELLKDASIELREWRKKATIVACRVRFSDFETITKQVRISATDAHQLIFPKVKELLHSLIKRRDKKVRLVGVRLSGFTTTPDRQLSLFPLPKKEEALRRLNKGLDFLRRKFGEDKVKEGKAYLT